MMSGCFGGQPRPGGPHPDKKPPEVATPSSQTATSAHPAALALHSGRLAVSFSGGGFLLPYHIGVVEVLLQLGVIRQRPPAPAAAGTGATATASLTAPTATAEGAHTADVPEVIISSMEPVSSAPPPQPHQLPPHPQSPPQSLPGPMQTATATPSPHSSSPTTAPGPTSAAASTHTSPTGTASGPTTAAAFNATNYTPLAGSSAGSLVAASLACGLSPAQLLSSFLDSVRDCRTGGSFRRLDQVLLRQLEASLPPNAHELCSGLATVGVTRLLPWPHTKRVSRFASRADLIAALLASCHIPRYFNGELSTSYRGKASVDGGVTSLIPKAAVEHDFLLKVCCFARRHVSRLPVLGRARALRQLDLGISPDAFGPWPVRLTVMLEHALHPSSDDFLVLLLQAGRGDAMRWAVVAGVAPPMLCSWVERWAAAAAAAAASAAPQQPRPSHELAEEAVAAAAAACPAAAGVFTDPYPASRPRPAAAEAAVASRAAAAAGGNGEGTARMVPTARSCESGTASVVGPFGDDGRGCCGLAFMPIPPELLLPVGLAMELPPVTAATGKAASAHEQQVPFQQPSAAAAPAVSPAAPAATASSPAADAAVGCSITHSDTAAAAAAAAATPSTSSSFAAVPTSQRYQQPAGTSAAVAGAGPVAVAEGVVSRAASSTTAPAGCRQPQQGTPPWHPQQQLQAQLQAQQQQPQLHRRHFLSCVHLGGRRKPDGGGASRAQEGVREHRKPKRQPYETAARLFVAGGKLMP